MTTLRRRSAKNCDADASRRHAVAGGPSCWCRTASVEMAGPCLGSAASSSLLGSPPWRTSCPKPSPIWMRVGSTQRNRWRAPCWRDRPKDVIALQCMGLAALRGGCPDEAVPWLRQAAKLQRGDAGLLTNLGVALKAAGRLDEAVQAFTLATRAAPGAGEIHFNLGNALQALRRDGRPKRPIVARLPPAIVGRAAPPSTPILGCCSKRAALGRTRSARIGQRCGSAPTRPSITTISATPCGPCWRLTTPLRPMTARWRYARTITRPGSTGITRRCCSQGEPHREFRRLRSAA